MFLGRGALDTTEFSRKRLVTNEKRPVQKLSGAVHPTRMSNQNLSEWLAALDKNTHSWRRGMIVECSPARRRRKEDEESPVRTVQKIHLRSPSPPSAAEVFTGA
jgi:hypothetical protein